jgi:TetR/AcrR family transcriptional repressor of bet genes
LGDRLAARPGRRKERPTNAGSIRALLRHGACGVFAGWPTGKNPGIVGRTALVDGADMQPSPGKKRGRPSNAAVRRAQIADVFISVVAERGFDGATLPEVARQLDVSPGLLHHHFSDKDEVVAVAIERLALRLELRAEQRLRHAKSPSQQLRALVNAWLSVDDDADPEGVRAWAAFESAAQANPSVRGVIDVMLARARTRFVDAVGAVHPDWSTLRRERVGLALLFAVEGALRVGTATTLLHAGDAAAAVQALVDAIGEGGPETKS